MRYPMPKKPHMTNDMLINAVYNATVRNGGTSVRVQNGQAPDHGYMVSIPHTEHRIPFATFVKIGKSVLHDYIKRNYDLIISYGGGPFGPYLGTWVDNETVYIDVSENISDFDTAMAVGRDRAQLAIWDVTNAQSITL